MRHFFKEKPKLGAAVSGLMAGLVNGLFGAGGGMLLLPLLTHLCGLKAHVAFACSVCVILPLSLVSLGVYFLHGSLDFIQALPYLIGGAVGGLAAGRLDGKIPTGLLHRLFGLMLLWGGFRYLR